jgi:hypothetical protein
MRGQTWDTVVTSLREEIVAGRAMAEALPKGWAPRFFGEADIDGNPAIAMELVRGKGVDELTPAQLIDLLTERGVAQAAAGIEIMRRAGWGGIDSPQFVLLTEDQTINGVARKRGDIVFVDAGALDRDQKRGWQKPQDAAADLIFMGALAREYRKLGISTPFDDTPVSIPEKQRRELMERARKAAQAYAHPDLSKFPAGGS